MHRHRRRFSLAARDCRDDAHGVTGGERGVEPAALARVDPVDVHVHELPEAALLVEEQVGDGKGAQRVANRAGVRLEAVPPARLRGKERRQDDYRHSATSIDSTGGSWRAASIHSSPSLGDTNTDPLCVPT